MENSSCGCPVVTKEEWDKKETTMDKMFYKTWSPRLLYFPFSMEIDINRAVTGAEKDGFTTPRPPMLLDTGGMFMSKLFVEVEGGKEDNPNVMSLKGKKLYTKASTRPWKEIGKDIAELKKEKNPKELYMWYTACPKCMKDKEVKTVLIGVL